MNAKDLIEAVRNLAAESPDNRYMGKSKCEYSRGRCTNGSCGCIIGQAIRKIDTEVFGVIELREAQDRFVGGILGLTEYLKEREIVFDCTDQERRWLIHVQSEQDCGKTWAVAVELADEMYHLG